MLKRKKGGSFHSLTSESDALLARKRIDEVLAQVYKAAQKAGIPAMLEEVSDLTTVLNNYVLNAERFEDDNWKATRVQVLRSSWDVEKLKRLLPPAIYKSVVKPTVDTAALNDAVKQEIVAIEDIEEALTETLNKPFVRWTAKSDTQAASEATAAKLEGLFS